MTMFTSYDAAASHACSLAYNHRDRLAHSGASDALVSTTAHFPSSLRGYAVYADRQQFAEYLIVPVGDMAWGVIIQ